jgi:hypothetical protein
MLVSLTGWSHRQIDQIISSSESWWLNMCHETYANMFGIKMASFVVDAPNTVCNVKGYSYSIQLMQELLTEGMVVMYKMGWCSSPDIVCFVLCCSECQKCCCTRGCLVIHTMIAYSLE